MESIIVIKVYEFFLLKKFDWRVACGIVAMTATVGRIHSLQISQINKHLAQKTGPIAIDEHSADKID